MFLWQQVDIDPAPLPVKVHEIPVRIGMVVSHPVAQGLNVGLSEKFQIQFLEDNQATITVISKHA